MSLGQEWRILNKIRSVEKWITAAGYSFQGVSFEMLKEHLNAKYGVKLHKITLDRMEKEKKLLKTMKYGQMLYTIAPEPFEGEFDFYV